MLLAGFGIPLMAAANASLGAAVGPAQSAILLFGAALIVSLAIAAGWGGVSPDLITHPKAWLGVAGLVVVFYILSITVAAPRIGVGTAVMLVLIGQLVSAALVDHFGWFGAIEVKISAMRLAGLALMAVGFVLARRPG